MKKQRASWWVTCLTAKVALAHDRRVYKVADDVGLGWTPYRFRVEHGAIAQTAFHTIEELRRWLDREGFEIERVSSNYIGCRTLWLKQRFECADCGKPSDPKHLCRAQARANRREDSCQSK
ncbi:MAG: hypothetical protein GY896_22725 [Gammaproteobacteria bacterium]|nr:hypothetical protein [Gammaproteobacteria bacterium]